MDPAGSQRTTPGESWAGGSTESGLNAAGRAGTVLVSDPAGLGPVAAGLSDAERERVFLDCETTGLDPRADRVRLLSLSLPNGDGGRVVYLIDCFRWSCASSLVRGRAPTGPRGRIAAIRPARVVGRISPVA
jgi:hypothetical protein